MKTKGRRRRCHCGHGYTSGRLGRVIVAFHDDPPCDAFKELTSQEFIATMSRRRAEVHGYPWRDLKYNDARDEKKLQQKVQHVLTLLSPRERTIIKLRFGLDGRREHTLKEIGATQNVGRERIRQIEAQALSKLRHPSCSKYLLPFVEDSLATCDRAGCNNTTRLGSRYHALYWRSLEVKGKMYISCSHYCSQWIRMRRGDKTLNDFLGETEKIKEKTDDVEPLEKREITCAIPEDTVCEASGCNNLVVYETSKEWYWFSCKVNGKEYKVCSRQCAEQIRDEVIRKGLN